MVMLKRWIKTFSGKHLAIPRPVASAITIEDIARGLAHTCRFAGQVAFYYTVAQHSVLVAEIARTRLNRPDLYLKALLHDAHEAFMGDLATPYKAVIPGYSKVARALQEEIAEAFDLPTDGDDVIARADEIALLTEAYALTKIIPQDWERQPRERPVDEKFGPVTPPQAHNLFMAAYARRSV